MLTVIIPIMSTIKNFEDPAILKMSRELVKYIYAETSPKDPEEKLKACIISLKIKNSSAGTLLLIAEIKPTPTNLSPPTHPDHNSVLACI